ncbi:MAG: hypothetical protein HWE30_13865 [Methylocystaceae bacterium]|nr:hypothetical protein [Methylocystaceae bacterium]
MSSHLDILKSIVRGADKKAEAFTSAREKASFTEKKALYQWIHSQTQSLDQRGKWPVISVDWPSNIMFLGRNFQLPPTEIKHELECLIARLSINSEEIQKYLEFRSSYIKYLRSEEWDKCKKTLIKIREKLGASFWFIENELLVERQLGGEEAQKHIRSIYHNNRELSRRTRFLASFFSERLEPFTLFSGFISRVHKSIDNSKSAPILEHLLTKRIPKEEDKLAELLCQLNSVPIIDAYESFIKILSCRLHVFGEHITVLNHIYEIDDPRLKKLATIINISKEITAKSKELEIYELLKSFDVEAYKFNDPNEEEASSWCYLNPKNNGLNHFAIKFENEKHASIKISPSDVINSAHIVMRTEENEKEISEYLKTEMSNYSEISEIWTTFSTINECFCEKDPFSCFNVIDVNLSQKVTPIELGFALNLSNQDEKYITQGKIKNTIRKIFYSNDNFIQDINRMFFCYNYLNAEETSTVNKILEDIPLTNLPYLVTSIKTSRLISEGKLEDCFYLASDFSLKYDSSFIQSIFKEKHEKLEWQHTKKWKSKLDLSIGIQQLGISKPNSKLQSAKRFAALSFLRSNSFNVPSEVDLKRVECEPFKIAYFLREVCTTETMDNMPLGFQTNLEQLQERMKICEGLMGYDAHNSSSIQTEIGELFGQIKLGNARRTLNRTRLYVDVANLSDFFERTHKADYSRIRRLSFAQESNEEEKETEEIVEKFLKGEQDLGDLTLELDNESNAAFLHLVKSYKDNFLENPKYGLNHYLSGRVRHGSFESPFHSIFKELGIWHTSTDNIDVLLSKLEKNNVNLDPSIHMQVVRHIERFTVVVYKTLRDIRLQNLQIRNTSHPHGFFSVNINQLSLRLLKQHALDHSEISSWTRLMNQIIWSSLEEEFPKMQSSLKVLLQDNILHKLDNLENELLKIISNSEQKTAISRLFGKARSQFNKAFTEISLWFQKPKSTGISKYSLDEMFDLFLKLFSKAHNIEKIKIYKNFDEGETVQHDFSVIYHVFFNIFNNIFKLTEDRTVRNVIVKISMHFIGINLLKIKVTNTIPDVFLQSSREMIEEKNKIIRSPDFIKEATNEGGSGLIKLFIALGSDVNRYKFFINQNNEFEMEFDIDVLRAE